MKSKRITQIMILILMLLALMANGGGMALAETMSAGTAPTFNYEIGKAYTYTWDGLIVSESEVDGHQGLERDVTIFEVSAEINLTPIERIRQETMLAVNVREATIKQVLDGQTVTEADPKELTEALQNPFYFQQSDTGEITALITSPSDDQETVDFKHGFIDAFQVQLQSAGGYDVVETGISGTYLSHYELGEGKGMVQVVRRRTDEDQILWAGSGDEDPGVDLDHHTDVVFDPGQGVIVSISTAEELVAAQSDPGPNLDDAYFDLTFTSMAQTSIELVKVVEVESASLTAASTDESLVTLPLAAQAITMDNTQDNGQLIAETIRQLQADPQNSRLLNQLIHALNEDANGVAQLHQLVRQGMVTADMSAGIVSVLVRMGTPEAQNIVLDNFVLNHGRSFQDRDRALMLLSMLDNPSERTVTVVAGFSQRESLFREQATLVLGALAHALTDSDPAQAAMIAQQLEAGLVQAESDDEMILYLNALGNAGQARSIEVIAGYFAAEATMVRTSAVEALRKMPLSQTAALLQARLEAETSTAVQAEMMSLLGEAQTEASLTTQLVDWAWDKEFGNSTVNATLEAQILVEDVPLYFLAEGELNAKAWSYQKELVRAGLKSELVNATQRKFEAYLYLLGNIVKSDEETVACSDYGSDSLIDESVTFFNETTPPIWVAGVLKIDFTIIGTGHLEVPYTWSYESCADETSAAGSITPEVRLDADGYATLDLFIVRGGIGIQGTILGAKLPLLASADVADGSFNTCHSASLELQVLDMELYAWYQFRKWTGGWGDRHTFTLWAFDRDPYTYTLVSHCSDGGTPQPPGGWCVGDVLWHDGTVIDATFNGQDCYVAPVPSGATPYTFDNMYYIKALPTTNCPSGTTYTAAGCLILSLTSPWVTYYESGGHLYLHFHTNTPMCPAGTTPVGQQDCYVRPIPQGHIVFEQMRKLYFTPVMICQDGVQEGRNCYLGTGPANTQAFAQQGDFYYSE